MAKEQRKRDAKETAEEFPKDTNQVHGYGVNLGLTRYRHCPANSSSRNSPDLLNSNGLILDQAETEHYWVLAKGPSSVSKSYRLVITWDELVPLQGMTIFNLLHLSIIPGWRERSKVKRRYWSCKGPKFKSRPRIGQLTTMFNSSSKESDASGLTYAYPYRDTHIYTEFKIK